MSASGFGLREVAKLSGATPARIRSLARAGLLSPERGGRGEWRFDFRDLAFLRRVCELPQTGLGPRRLRRALLRLRAWLPPDRDLRELGLATAAGELVVRDADTLFSPESGQCVFDFTARRASSIVTLEAEGHEAEPARSDAEPERRSDPLPSDAERWYRLGCELERADLSRAREAYERALAADPAHADTHVNLGCLKHEAGRLAAAEAHYRAALSLRPADATARFDLAVVLEDRDQQEAAREAYRACLASDPQCADAHVSLARIAERCGEDQERLRHLVAARRLLRQQGEELAGD